MDPDSVVRQEPESDLEIAFEGALRPRSLAEFVGQSKVRGQLELLLKAAALQNRTPDHIPALASRGLPVCSETTTSQRPNLSRRAYGIFRRKWNLVPFSRRLVAPCI